MSTITTPDRTLQRFEALATANPARLRGAVLKRDLAALGREDGQREAARVLIEEPGAITSMRAFQFLESVPGIGYVAARTCLTSARIYAAKPCRELTERQRRTLADWLLGHARGTERRRGPDGVYR